MKFIVNNPLKSLALAATVVTALIVGLNSYTTVPAGHVKVQSVFGKVDSGATKGEGFHFVNPMASFDTMSVRNDKYEIDGLNIPTQDRFNSTGNVTVLYNIDASKAAYIRINYGTASQFLDKTLRQHLRSIIRDEGRKQADSRSLAVSANVAAMQENARVRLIEQLDGTGINIQEVLIQDIAFDPRIAQQILKTQERIQKEETEESALRIATTQAQTAKETARGVADAAIQSARGKAESEILKATAAKDSAILRAQGKADGIKLIAEANLKLTKSLTPQILRKQELDNQAILNSKYKGGVPQMVIGTDHGLSAVGLPIAASN